MQITLLMMLTDVLNAFAYSYSQAGNHLKPKGQEREWDGRASSPWQLLGWTPSPRGCPQHPTSCCSVLLHLLAGLGCRSRGEAAKHGLPSLEQHVEGNEPVFCGVIIAKLKEKPRRGNLISADLVFCQEGAVVGEDAF